MSIIRIEDRLLSRLALKVNSPIKFVSHSDGQPITGSASLFSERSSAVKSQGEIGDIFFDDSSLRVAFETEQGAYVNAINTDVTGNFASTTSDLLNEISGRSSSNSNFRSVDIRRFESPFVYDVNFAAARAVKNLYQFYKRESSNYDYSFRNYNTLNFFTSSQVPDNSGLVYLARADQFGGSNPYLPESAFTLDFYINPRYTTVNQSDEFSAGTVMFMSSSYAVSLVTGSEKDNQGRPSGYRVMLQLSHSVDTGPDNVDLSVANNARSYPEDLIFLSSDNSLLKDHWHHVSLRWGSSEFNNFTGSIYVDNQLDSTFLVPSSSISSSIDPNALFVGIRYEGSNTGASSADRYFNTANAQRNGVPALSGYTSNPTGVSLVNPLNAEVHDLKMFNTFRTTDQIYSSSIAGIASTSEPGLKFYVPPFFTKESPSRQVLVEPFAYKNNTVTRYPFEVTQSMGLRSRLINIENYLRDFSTGNYPLPLSLTGSIQSTSVSETEIENVMYRLPEIRKRNLTILPNDNGKFRPAFSLLLSGNQADYDQVSSPLSRFRNDFGSLDLSKITLRNVIETTEQARYNSYANDIGDLFDADLRNSTRQVFITDDNTELTNNQTAYNASIRDSQRPINTRLLPYEDRIDSLDETSRAFVADNVNIVDTYFQVLSRGFIPTLVKQTNTQPNAGTGPYLSVPFLLGDYDSNELYYFNISNLYYGDSIEKESFVLTDSNLSGSGNAVSLTLKDVDGSLYRSDCKTPVATWNDVGNIFYDEGIVVVKNPLMPQFGKNGYDLQLSGTREINVLEVNIPCPSGQMDSSSNPTYVDLKPNNNANETSRNFTYITNVNLHDENLNIIGKATFSQPIRKRPNDGFLTRIKIDY